MDPIASRAAQAEQLWSQGLAAFERGERARSYALYTQAHDLVTDCAKLHIRAHQYLRTVTREHGHRGEWWTDRVLLALAPFGMFELIAWYFRSRVGADARCRRGAA